MRLATAQFFHDRRGLRLLAVLIAGGGVLAAWFLAGHVFLAARDQVVAEAELPVPEGFCPLSWRDSKELQARAHLALLNSLSEYPSQGLFVECREGVIRWTQADGQRPLWAYYTLGQAHSDDWTQSDFLDSMAKSYGGDGPVSLEQAEDALAAGGRQADLGVLFRDDAAVYRGTLWSDDRGAIQASVFGFTLKDGVMITLTINAPHEDAAQLQRLIEIERETLRALLEAN